MTVDVGGPLTTDKLVEMLEKLDLAFDPEGKLDLTMVAHPSLEPQIRRLLEDPDARQRIEEVIARKRREWFSR